MHFLVGFRTTFCLFSRSARTLSSFSCKNCSGPWCSKAATTYSSKFCKLLSQLRCYVCISCTDTVPRVFLLLLPASLSAYSGPAHPCLNFPGGSLAPLAAPFQRSPLPNEACPPLIAWTVPGARAQQPRQPFPSNGGELADKDSRIASKLDKVPSGYLLHSHGKIHHAINR